MTAAQPSQATLLGRWLFLNLLRLLGAVAIGWAIGVQVGLLLSWVFSVGSVVGLLAHVSLS
jgi:hypothetical protein